MIYFIGWVIGMIICNFVITFFGGRGFVKNTQIIIDYFWDKKYPLDSNVAFTDDEIRGRENLKRIEKQRFSHHPEAWHKLNAEIAEMYRDEVSCEHIAFEVGLTTMQVRARLVKLGLR